ncbi:MAG TPA: RraA family protein [Gaiellaceae bacterium]
MSAEPVSAAAVADACVLERVTFTSAPRSVTWFPTSVHRVNGRAIVVEHRGSVDVFLEAFGRAATGDVLVVDNAGRDDEGCIGDLVALEAANAGVAGIVIWGRHRDSAVLATLPLGLWSCGTNPAGPAGARESTQTGVFVGDASVNDGDLVVADEDGVLFVPGDAAERALDTAREIEWAERRQAERARGGESLREQLRFDEYLERRAADPSFTFREHLRAISSHIEA